MTKRSVIIALLCAVAIGGFTYFHDCIINPGAHIRIVPHLMPHVVYGGLLLAILLANPMLRVLRCRLLSGRELAFVTGICLVACSVPFYGLVHCWPSALMLPHHYNRTTPGWQRENVIDLVPPLMLTDVASDAGLDALTGYVAGMGQGHDHISPRRVPWAVWVRPLAFWVPLVLSISIAMLALAVVVHRQWSRHEQLPYPISVFASLLLPDNPNTVLRARAFRVTMAIVLGVHMVNYLHAWWPDYLIPIRLRLDFTPLVPLFRPVTWGDGGSLFSPRIMFAVIGIAYFFASDVSFTLAVTPYIECYIMGILTGYGLQVTRGFSLYNNSKVFLYTGGYVGIVMMLIYTGRYYYGNLLRQGLWLPCRERTEPYLAVAMRVFLLGLAVFWTLLLLAGLDWLLASFYALTAIVVFTAVSRAVAEAGAFWVGTWVMPSALAWGFFGARAVGPTAFATMAMVCIVVLVGPGWAPMPFAVQALKLAELGNVRLGRMGLACVLTLVLCVGVALPATIYCQHDGGVMSASSGWARYTPRLPFDQGLVMKQQLAALDLLDSSESVRGFERLANLKPNRAFVISFVIGVTLAVVVSLMRLRFPWWPLHPIAFLFFGSHQAQYLAFSFLLGWLVKTAVCKYGGEPVYQKGKPIMAGLIAGEVLAGTIPVVAGTLYYFITGERPVNVSIVL